MIVIGAGMAGLLAAGMLRGECSRVVEASPDLPNNHSAVLRFRSRVVSEALNIRFKEVTATKAVHPWRNPVADALSYSLKTNGTATFRSVLSADAKPVTRYIAPPDMVQRMAERVTGQFIFDCKVRPEDLSRSEEPIISTIPMPALMKLMGWTGAGLTFDHILGVNYGTRVAGVDAYCSVYDPSPASPISRVSLTGDELVAECYGQKASASEEDIVLARASHLLGLPLSSLYENEVWRKRQKYAKILPIPESIRREFIMWASDRGVYSLGRYATWRPGLLLDDLVNDVRVIQQLAADRGASYDHKLKGN